MRPSAYVVDDHAGFRAAASALLGTMGYDVIGSAGDGHAALAELQGVEVDLVLLDLYLPGDDGVEVATQIAAGRSATTVVLVSSREDAGSDARVVAAPIAGFISKRDLSPTRLRALLP